MLAPMRTVLVHGLAGSSRWWRELEPRLAELGVDAVDLPRLPSAELEEWLAARLEPRASLVAHSLGGLLAARIAARRPELVDRLVLIAPVGIPLRGVLAHAVPLGLTLLQVRPRFAAVVARDALRAGPTRLLAGAWSAVRDDVRSDLSAVRAPTLLVWGERDRLVPARNARAWASALPDARVELVPRAGHVPMVERPEELSRLLREFLAAR